jgi:hypothetical protein
MAISLLQITSNTALSKTYQIINDTNAIIQETLNKILSIVDIGTGKFNNSAFATDNNIETQNVISKGNVGVQVNLGHVTVATGSLKLTGTSSRIEIGTTLKVERITKNTSLGTLDIIDLTGLSGAVTGDGTVAGVVLPRMNNGAIIDIVSPNEGLLVWDTTNKKLKIYNGTAWEDLN